MNGNKIEIGIVCGYGTVMDARTKDYLETVANETSRYHLNHLILSGGISDPRISLSEAELMSHFFSMRFSDVELILEPFALTTLHNLFYSNEIIKNEGLKAKCLYIFCDDNRYLKVKLLSMIIFRGIATRIISVKRPEPIKILLLQLPSILYQLVGAVNPWTRRKIEEGKKKYISRKR